MSRGDKKDKAGDVTYRILLVSDHAWAVCVCERDRQEGKGWQAYDVIRWHLVDRGHATDGAVGWEWMCMCPYPWRSSLVCVCVGHGDTFGFRSDVTLIGPKGCKVQVTRWSCGHHGDHGQSLQLLWPFSYANSSASFKRRPFPSSQKYRIQSSKDTAGKKRETSTILWITLPVC